MNNSIHEGLWSDSEWSLTEYQTDMPTEEEIKAIEKELGYRFPDAYLDFMKVHNGGLVKKGCYTYLDSETQEEREIMITGFLGIGCDKENTIMGTFGSQFWIDEWEYPNIGIVICDCASGGHDMVFLDYRECGPEGEPCVSHVDQESDYRITKIADSFEMFVSGLDSEKNEYVSPSQTASHSTSKFGSIFSRMRKSHSKRIRK